MYLDLIPVVLVILIWDHSFKFKKLILKIVNEAVVQIKKKISVRVINRLGPMQIRIMHQNIQIKCVDVPGCTDEMHISLSVAHI